jgi:hypothetical protein
LHFFHCIVLGVKLHDLFHAKILHVLLLLNLKLVETSGQIAGLQLIALSLEHVDHVLLP